MEFKCLETIAKQSSNVNGEVGFALKEGKRNVKEKLEY